MCNIDKIEKEIDVEMNNTIEEYLNTTTTIQDDSTELQVEITSDIDMKDYDLEKKSVERFLGEI